MAADAGGGAVDIVGAAGTTAVPGAGFAVDSAGWGQGRSEVESGG